MKYHKHPTDPGMDYTSSWQCGEKLAKGKLCLAEFDEYDDLEKHYASEHRKEELIIAPPPPKEPECVHNPEPNFKGLMSMTKETAVGVFIDICSKCGKELSKEYEVKYKSNHERGDLF
jgi:hypothetical protein